MNNRAPLDLVVKNSALMVKVQTVLAIVLSYACFYLIQQFRYYCEQPIRFGQRVFYCFNTGLVLSVVAFVLKLVIAYQPYSRRSVKDGSLSADSNQAYMTVMKALMPSLFITYFGLRGHLFIHQFIVNVFVVFIIIWLQFNNLSRKVQKLTEERKFRRLLSGNTQITDKDVIRLPNFWQIRVIGKPMGFGCHGTVYPCGYGNSVNNLVVKVINLEQWMENRYSSNVNIECKILVARDEFVKITALWSQIKHPNVVQYTTIGPKRRSDKIFVVTSIAKMNLDFFLTHIQPNGVPEDWAHEWFKQLCEGVNHLHFHQLAHSNIKPENILLFPRPDRFDFAKDQPLAGISHRYAYDLMLTDYGYEVFLPLNGRVITKRDPIVMIGPPNRTIGRSGTKFMVNAVDANDWPNDDIYLLAVVLLLMMNGDLHRLIKMPNGIECSSLQESGIDYVGVRLDKINLIRKLPNKPTKELEQLLKMMTAYEPSNRFTIGEVMAHKWYQNGPKINPRSP